jgi:hypothetical protein
MAMNAIKAVFEGNLSLPAVERGERHFNNRLVAARHGINNIRQSGTYSAKE